MALDRLTQITSSGISSTSTITVSAVAGSITGVVTATSLSVTGSVTTGLDVSGIVTATTVQVGSATTIHTTGIDLGSGNITSHNINSTGIITSTSFVGPVTGNVTGDLTGNVSSSGANTLGSLTVTNDATVGGALTVTGDLTVNGTTTTIDTAVTAVDSLAIDGDASVGGSIGIGTDNPDRKLESVDTANSLTYPVAVSNHTSASTGVGAAIDFRLASNGVTRGELGLVYAGNNNSDGTDFVLKPNDGSTGNIERLRIKGSNGNIGIGTDNPQSFLSLRQDGGGFEVNANSGSNNARLLSYDRVASSYREMTFQALSYGFETSGSEKLRITSGGNVGIGTDTPNLQSTSANNLVIADFGGEGGITIKTNINSSGNIFFADTAATANGRIAYGHGTLDTGDYMRFYVANEEKLRIKANGYVGIGTNNPTSTLDVRSNDTRFKLTSNGSGQTVGMTLKGGASDGFTYNFIESISDVDSQNWYIGGNGTANTFAVKTGGSEKLRITSSGDVGIGTDTPTERVHLDLGTFGSNNQDDFHGYLLSGDCTGNQGYIGYRTYLENSSADFGAYVRATRYAGSTFVGMEIGTDTNNRPIRFLTGGTTDTYERMRIQETGIVFIGDATPAASENGQLNVYTTTSGGLSQFVHSAGNGGLRLGGTGNGSAAHLVFSNDYNSGTWSDEYTIRMDGSDDSLRFLSGGVSGTERVRMRSDGNVVHLVSCISSGSGSDINSFYNNKEGCGMFTQGAYSILSLKQI